MKRLGRLDFTDPPAPGLPGRWLAVGGVALLAALAALGAGLWRGDAGRTAPTVDAAAAGAAPAAPLPWAELLATFDDHATPRIDLLRFEPDAPGRVRVTARASDAATVAAFLRRLQDDPRLRDVVLVAQHAEAGAPAGPVWFTMLAGWRGAAPVRRVTLARPSPGPAAPIWRQSRP